MVNGRISAGGLQKNPAEGEGLLICNIKNSKKVAKILIQNGIESNKHFLTKNSQKSMHIAMLHIRETQRNINDICTHAITNV